MPNLNTVYKDQFIEFLSDESLKRKHPEISLAKFWLLIQREHNKLRKMRFCSFLPSSAKVSFQQCLLYDQNLNRLNLENDLHAH